MSIRLYADASVVVIYEEAPGGGDPLDPLSLMNRPIVAPLSWLDNIYFHSDLDYYSTSLYVPTVTITHAAVPTASASITPFLNIQGQIIQASHVLANHLLGYVPRFFVIYDGKMIPHGTPVQAVSSTVVRFVSAYATTTQIGLFETGISGAADLPAVNINYGVMVFRNSAADPLLAKLMIEPGNVIFGQGKFNMQWPHLRVVGVGESPFAQALGKTAAIDSGSIRVWPPNGSPIDFGPYAGSFVTPPAFVNLAAGV